MENSILKKRVMTRIYIEYGKNLLVKNMEFLVLAIILVSISLSVSLTSVFNNMPKDDMSNTYTFLKSAIRDTENLVKMEGFLAVLWLAALSIRFAPRKLSNLKFFFKFFNVARLRY